MAEARVLIYDKSMVLEEVKVAENLIECGAGGGSSTKNV